MELNAYEEDNRLYYEIKNYDEALEETFKRHGYIKHADAYIKAFPLTFPYKDKIIRNYIRDAEAMFYEEAGLKPFNWREGFESFALLAKKHNLDWWTTGRILLPLYGIKAEISDVDFYFYKNDLDAIYDVFSDYIIEPIVGDTWRSNVFEYYGLAYLNCTVCMLVEPRESLDIPEPVHFGRYASNNLITVNRNGLEVKAPPIELYIKTLKSWGMTETAESIEGALKK